MEAIQFHEFCRALSRWPEKPVELAGIVERLSVLLSPSWVWISVPEVGEKFSGIDSDPSHLLRIQIDRIPEAQTLPGMPPRQIQIADTSFANTSTVAIARLADGGWLAVGSAKALPPRTEIALLAVVNQLSLLYSYSEQQKELALRDQFLSIASHELKTPLTSIYGILQLQERMLRPKPDRPTTPEQEKQHSFFKIVIRQVERLNELIDGLLDVSRIQNGRFVVEPSESDAAILLSEAVDSRLQVIAAEAGVRIQLDAPPHLPAWVDPIRFEEVVTNLGMNAVRFSPEGGVIWMKLRAEGDELILTVRDQGPCVTNADKQRLFQPFERAARTTRLGGLGLGLFISRQIAQLHGGTVVLAESIAGKGNLFEAHFPLHRRHQLTA